MKNLAAVIGNEGIGTHIIPSLIELSNDKNWRVKLSVIEFVPQLCDFLDKNTFKDMLEPIVFTWMTDPVFQIREEAVNILATLKDKLFN